MARKMSTAGQAVFDDVLANKARAAVTLVKVAQKNPKLLEEIAA